jgi:hypothetical protein
MRMTPLLVLGGSLLAAATARADDAAPAAAKTGPVAGSWSVSIAPALDIMPGGDIGAMGAVGAELDVGKRLSDRLYLGVTGEAAHVFGKGLAADVPSLEMRAGGELRYTFANLPAFVSTWGHYHPPRSFWLGLRAGAESIDANTLGAFGDVTLGTDIWVSGHTSIGSFIRAGLSFEPDGSFGESTTPTIESSSTDPFSAPTIQRVPSSPSGPVPYIGAGLRLTFGG